MFILTYSSPTTGNVAELFSTREAADAEAADVRRAMDAVGYGAHADSVRVQDTDGMTDAETWELPEDVQARIVAAEWEAHDRRIDARMDGHDWVPGVSVIWWTCRCGWATTDPRAAAEHNLPDAPAT